MLTQLRAAPARARRPPIRYANPVYTGVPCMVVVAPFLHENSGYEGLIRLPAVEVKESSIPNSGYGLFVNEAVLAGDAITLYARNAISEHEGKIRMEQVRTYRYQIFSSHKWIV
jgi:hypothetical protein